MKVRVEGGHEPGWARELVTQAEPDEYVEERFEGMARVERAGAAVGARDEVVGRETHGARIVPRPCTCRERAGIIERIEVEQKAGHCVCFQIGRSK